VLLNKAKTDLGTALKEQQKFVEAVEMYQQAIRGYKK
jgi:hypothetical protein